MPSTSEGCEVTAGLRMYSPEWEAEQSAQFWAKFWRRVPLIVAGALLLAAGITALVVWQSADTPRYECFTVTHLDYSHPETVYTSTGEELGANGHIGMFREGQSWCGMVGHNIGAGRGWIEDNQNGGAGAHATG